MSEADSPNDQSASDPIVSSSEPAVDAAAGEGWQTLDFPGAISIDALPLRQVLLPNYANGSEMPNAAIGAGIIHYSTPEIKPEASNLVAFPSAPDATAQLQQLQQENAALRDRLTQVELDLVQHQIEWQLETACSQTAPTTGEAAEMPYDRLHQLLQELERSQQTAQHQQIVVETLTEQMGSSQERIAQLERDCALTQQRYNEQVQQVLQAESACRDLRLRLHRQQQQTLQFKAALEKCLEMPPTEGQQHLIATVFDDIAAPQTLSALLKPKNQPVKPWSLPSETTQAGTGDHAELPKPLFKLLKHEAEQGGADLQQEGDDLSVEFTPHFSRNDLSGEPHGYAIASPLDSSALLDADDPHFVTHLMQLIFPDAAEPLAYPSWNALEADVLSQAESVLDRNPFLEVSPASADTFPSRENPSQAAIVPEPLLDELAASARTDVTPYEALEVVSSSAGAIAPMSALLRSEDPPADALWKDLATLIDPPTIVDSTDATVDTAHPDIPVRLVNATPDRAGIPPISTPSHAAVPADGVSSNTPIGQTASPLTAWTWRDRLSRPHTLLRTPIANRAVLEGDIESPPQSSSKLLALNALDRQAAVMQPVSASSQSKLTSAPFSTPMPSPIVYPLRSSKKLASLAAVDLPTFPKH